MEGKRSYIFLNRGVDDTMTRRMRIIFYKTNCCPEKRNDNLAWEIFNKNYPKPNYRGSGIHHDHTFKPLCVYHNGWQELTLAYSVMHMCCDHDYYHQYIFSEYSIQEIRKIIESLENIDYIDIELEEMKEVENGRY